MPLTPFIGASTHRLLFTLATLLFGVGALLWLIASQRARRRSLALDRRGLPATRWRALGQQELLGGLLFACFALVSAAEVVQGDFGFPDVFILAALIPLTLSMVGQRHFRRLLTEMESDAESTRRDHERAFQDAALADRLAQRLNATDVSSRHGVTLRTLYEPSEGVVGGDFLGALERGDEVLLFVGDVSGHGLEAALMALRLKDLLLAGAQAGLGLRGMLELANAHLSADDTSEMFATVFVARHCDERLVYANAGHPPALLVSEGDYDELYPTGPLLGLTEDADFDETTTTLAPGTRLVAYTDGLLEPFGRWGGLEAEEIAQHVRDGAFRGLIAAVRSNGDEPLRDDVAAVELAHS